VLGDPPQCPGFGSVTVEIDGTAKTAVKKVGKCILTSNGRSHGSHCDCIMLQIVRVRFDGALICS